MTPDQFLRLLTAILGAEEQEIVCSEFFAHLPAYVDFTLAARDPSRPPVPPQPMFPAIAHHIAQCAECGDAYAALLEITRSAQ